MKKLKVMLIGIPNIGKTSLIEMLNNNIISKKNYLSTIGSNLRFVNWKNTKIGFWDISGKYSYSFLATSFIDSCDVILFCYSVNDELSFYKMTEKYQDLLSKGLLNNKKTIIVCTKIDLAPQKEGQLNEYYTKGKYFSAMKNCPFISTSSYHNFGRENLLDVIVDTDVKKKSRGCCFC